jgi:hypothetical protein
MTEKFGRVSSGAAELCGVLLRPRSFSLPPRVPRRTRGTRTPAYRRGPPAGYAVVQRYASHPHTVSGLKLPYTSRPILDRSVSANRCDDPI